jgi:hypothetical protein
MKLARGLLWAVVTAAATASSAQPVAPKQERPSEVTVVGRRSQPSDWREAETEHVIVLSNGGERELTRIAHDLERLHFLLSVLLNRTDKEDETIKLRVTLVGDVAQFAAMDLRNLRWQQGPFNDAFDIRRYYDPREDGAVMATTRFDQRAVLERGVSVSQALMGLQLPGISGANGAPAAQSGLFGLQSQPDLIPNVNEESVPLSAAGMVQAGFAQHFLQTYFPAAYPRWYLDGFGQVFSTMTVRKEGVVEYGRAPVGSSTVLQKFGSYPLADVLNGRYLEQRGDRTRWTPVHAWMLTHFLFFSPTRSGQFRQYLRAIANGTEPTKATAVFGDLDVLANELRSYYRAKKPYEQMTYPVERAETPTVRRLTTAQAAFVIGRLELGSRVFIPPAPPADAAPADAVRMTKDRTAALAARDKWLARVRSDAARFPGDDGAQLLLAEAECRSGLYDACRSTADRILAQSPGSGPALTWQGAATAGQALGGPVADRDAGLRTARAAIAKANRLDTEAVLPLAAYFHTFADAGTPPPVVAIDGLTKAMIRVPNAPTTRLALGDSLTDRGNSAAARSVLMPVAVGAYDSPERASAVTILRKIGALESPAKPDN